MMTISRATPLSRCLGLSEFTNTQLHQNPGIDDSMSGTTAISMLVHGRTLYVANVGDSRAVMAQKRPGGEIVAIDLSCDQTPFRNDECQHVRTCGARVLSLDQLEGLKDPVVQSWGTEEDADDGGDPPRLWVPNGNYPGTAFTRSIGDDTAEAIGVIAIPEINVVNINSDNPFFVIASDGVFEFLSSQAVVDMETLDTVHNSGINLRKFRHKRRHQGVLAISDAAIIALCRMAPMLEELQLVDKLGANQFRISFQEFKTKLLEPGLVLLYRAFDEIEGIEVAWNHVKLSNVLKSPEDLQRLCSEGSYMLTSKHDVFNDLCA